MITIESAVIHAIIGFVCGVVATIMSRVRMFREMSPCCIYLKADSRSLTIHGECTSMFNKGKECKRKYCPLLKKE